MPRSAAARCVLSCRFPDGLERDARGILADMPEDALPEALSLEAAYRAACFLTDLWVSLDSEPGEGLLLFQQYLRSDPARWDDWKASVRKALTETAEDPLTDNLGPLD
jgi:hypothetical protein